MPESHSDEDLDFLDELIAESTKANPAFPELMKRAQEAREIVLSLRDRRLALGISQAVVAKRMGTHQSAVARLESEAFDSKVSTLQKYAAAVGASFEMTLRDPVERAGAGGQAVAVDPSTSR